MEKIYDRFSQHPHGQQEYRRLCCLMVTIFIAITISITAVMVAFTTIFELRDSSLVLRINFEEILDSRNTTDGRNYESFKLALKFDGDVNSIMQKVFGGTTVKMSKEASEAVAELMATNEGRLRVDVRTHGRATKNRNIIIRVTKILTTVVRGVANGLMADERTMIRLLLVICWGCFFWNVSLWLRLSSYVDPFRFYGAHV